MTLGYLRTPDLDLSGDLHQKIIDAIDQSRCEQGQYLDARSPAGNWFERLIYRIWFGNKGHFQVYRLPDQLRDEVLDHYQEFITVVGETPKVRLKSSKNIKRLIPHSDGGDKSSLTIGVRTNGEETRWFDRGSDFEITVWNLLKLKKVSSVRVQEKEAYFYDNQRVHDMHGSSGSDRFLLVLSWSELDFSDLRRLCDRYIKSHDRTH